MEALMRNALVVLALAIPAGLAAQTPTPAPTGTAVAQSEATLRPRIKPTRSNVVEIEELRAVEGGTNALMAVRRLRPEFLARHAPPRAGDQSETGYAVVYLDGARLGGPEMLESIPASVIYRIRFLRASEAAAWVGREHRGGVIAVTTIR
jgi:hypothetical protein